MPNKKLTYSDLKEKYGNQVECLSYDRDYENAFSRLEWRCTHGHQFVASVNSLRNMEIYCPTCRKIHKNHKRQLLMGNRLQECRQYAISKGGECLTEEIANNQSTIRWKCAHNHEWEMTFDYLKNRRTKGDWCPVCSREFDERARHDSKFSVFQRIVIAKIAPMLRDHGYTLETVSSALSITLYDLEYCCTKYQNAIPEDHLQHEELRALDERVEQQYMEAISLIEKNPSQERESDLYFKIAASSVAKDLIYNQIPLADIADGFGVERGKLYYWIKTLLPRYAENDQVLRNKEVLSQKKTLLAKTNHLVFDRDDPLSDIDRLKKSIEFKVAIVSILGKYNGSRSLTKTDIKRCFNIQWNTLSRWEKTISHKIRLGEIRLEKHNQTLQSTIEAHLLSSADA